MPETNTKARVGKKTCVGTARAGIARVGTGALARPSRAQLGPHR
jgi:hypothetical protein